MKSFTLLASVCLVVVFFTGCQGPVPGVHTTREPLETYSNLVYIDGSLTSQVPCQVLEAKKTDSGRMEVYARFFNERDEAVESQIRLKFKGEDGRIVDQTGWLPFLLPRREVTEFRHTSLTKDASDFVLLLREAR